MSDGSNGNGAGELDDEFRLRWARQAQEHDRARELEHRLDFVLAEVRDLRRFVEDKFARLIDLREQDATAIVGIHKALAGQSASLTALEKRRKPARRK